MTVVRRKESMSLRTMFTKSQSVSIPQPRLFGIARAEFALQSRDRLESDKSAC